MTNKTIAELLESRLLMSTYWVSPGGSNSNDGSSDAPLQTITYALTKATEPGDVVLVKGGIYRGERAEFVASGVAGNPITLAAAPGETPIVRGSEVVTDWTLSSGAIYRANWTRNFGSWNAAFTSVPQGNTSSMDARNKARNQFFVDGAYLEEVPRQMDLKAGSFWLDRTNKHVYVWLADSSNPASHRMEGTTTQDALLRTNGKDHLVIRGLTFEHSSNQSQGNAMVRIDAGTALDDTTTSDHVLAENIVARFAAGAGFGMTGNNNVLRNSDLTDNGQLGLHAGATGSHNRVEGGHWLRNNTLAGKQFNVLWEAGGGKITRSRHFIVDGIEAAYNRGRGIWFDLDNRDAIIRNNRSHHNQHGLHYEISYTATIYNNLFYQNLKQGDDGEVGIGIHVTSSAGTLIFNNTTFGNDGAGINVNSDGSSAGGTRAPRQVNGLDMSSYAIQVYNNIVAENQRDRYKLSYVVQNDPPVPKELTDDDPTTNPVVPWAPNTSDYNLFYLGNNSPAFPGGYPYPRKFFNGSPNPQWNNATDFVTLAFADWQERTGWDANSIWNADPQLLLPYGADFRLAADSPAHGAGLFQAAGPVDVSGTTRSESGTDIGAHQMLIIGDAPTVATAASATPRPVTGTTTTLRVLGADDGGESNLTYTWVATGTPPAPVKFSANGTNAAKNTTATFTKAGTYDFLVTVRDSVGQRVTSTVSVTVNQTLTNIALNPAVVTVNANATQQFTAGAFDQFGHAMSVDLAWSVSDGAGTITADGLYTAPSTAGEAIVQVTSGSVTRTSSVTIVPATVVGRHLFYNRSYFDGNNPAANATGGPSGLGDDGAIATDKIALLPGGTASFLNYSSYSRGINGIMVDVANLAPGVALGVGDFAFRVGNSNTPAGWTMLSGSYLPSISVRSIEGSDVQRYTLIWDDNEVQKQWLQVTVKASSANGLAADDVFYFGNAIGEVGNAHDPVTGVTRDALINATDVSATRANSLSVLVRAPITYPYDHNRDGLVNATDVSIIQSNTTSVLAALKMVTVPATVLPAATGNRATTGTAGIAALPSSAGVSTTAAGGTRLVQAVGLTDEEPAVGGVALV